VLVFDGIKVVPELRLELLAEAIPVDRRQRLDDRQGCLYHAGNVVNALGVEPSPPGIQFSRIERSAGTKVDEQNLVAGLDQNVGRMQIGMEENMQ